MAFYMYLPSNSSYSFFPENRTNDYFTKLANKIHLAHNSYEVALTEFSYVNNFVPFYDESSRQLRIQSLINETLNDELLSIPDKNYKNMLELVLELNTSIDRVTSDILFSYNFTTCKVSLTIKNASLVLSAELAWKLKFFVKNNKKIVRPKIFFAGGEYISEEHESNEVTNDMNHLFIYSNILEPQYVGDSFAPLLRMVNITGKRNDNVSVSFRPYYKTVSCTEFDNIHIKICNEFGEPINFAKGPVSATLHFRPIKI